MATKRIDQFDPKAVLTGSELLLVQDPTSLLYNKATLSSALTAAASGVTSVAGRTGAVVLTKSDVGLSNVPNLDTTTAVSQTHSHSNTTALNAVTGTNTGDQDLSSYATTTSVTTGLAAKQATLVSGTNIKTINSTSLLGSGDIVISGGTSSDATTVAKGIVQLAGDLAGTAVAPTVPGLTTKAPLAAPAFTGNATFDGTTLDIDATNHRVGIGTAAPGSALHLKGTTGTGVTIENVQTNGKGYVYITDNTSGNNFFEFDVNGSGTGNTNLLSIPNSGLLRSGSGSTGGMLFVSQATGAPIIFATGGFANANERMRIDTNGAITTNSTVNGRTMSTDGTKLDGIATGATANSPDATLLSRANHTGTQTASTISDFSTAADARISAAAGVSVASLSGGKIPSSQIPAIGLVSVQTAASQAAQLALTTQEGDVVVRTDTNVTYMRNAGVAGTMADFTLLNTPTAPVTSVNGQTGVVTGLATDTAVVHNTGAETIAGVKTFSSTIAGSINGNAATVTTNANLTGDVTSVGNATTLASTIGSSGTTGSSGTVIPVISYDAKGRITAMSSTAVATPTTISGSITESQVTNLTTDLAAKQATLTLTTTGTSGAATLVGATLNIPNYAASGGGITRSINTITTTTTAGAVASTDYVYFCNGTFTVTLPAAASNTNRYTVKNVGSGVITVAGTIDGSTNAVLSTQYQSIDLLSNNTSWNVV